LTGYSLSISEAQATSEPIPGPATTRIIGACQESDIIVAMGMLEIDHEGLCFNTAVLLGLDGEKSGEGSKDKEEILVAEIDLARSENKKRIFVPGEYEIDLYADRRPELYKPITNKV